jgi:prepilin-type N-terminal cleavage/methylation domain-containing protein
MSNPSRRPLHGFTLVELLVVIGIIAVLIALLFPALSVARRQANNVVCANTLRQLVTAATAFRADNDGHYPPPVYNTLTGGCYPSDVQTQLINELAPYLGYAKLTDPFAAPVGPLPAASAVPQVFCNPIVYENQTVEGPSQDNGPTYWNTGYEYVGGLNECAPASAQYPSIQNPTILTPTRVATRTQNGVLFADDVVWYGYGIVVWQFPHGQGVNEEYTSPQSLIGQHCAWADGSVEWRPASSIHIQANDMDASAGYKLYVGFWYYYWWF